jgi:hypothetical protein
VDLVILVVVLVYLLTTKVPMPPYWAMAIQIGALIVVILFLLRRFGGGLPNVLP